MEKVAKATKNQELVTNNKRIDWRNNIGNETFLMYAASLTMIW